MIDTIISWRISDRSNFSILSFWIELQPFWFEGVIQPCKRCSFIRHWYLKKNHSLQSLYHNQSNKQSTKPTCKCHKACLHTLWGWQPPKGPWPPVWSPPPSPHGVGRRGLRSPSLSMCQSVHRTEDSIQDIGGPRIKQNFSLLHDSNECIYIYTRLLERFFVLRLQIERQYSFLL